MPPTPTPEVDADGDGYSAAIDCNDGNFDINPGATEICDSLDNDCDEETDEGVTTAYFFDADGDGYGAETPTLEACDKPEGYAAVSGDCDDTLATVNPGQAETCDNLDNDCNGSADEGLSFSDYFEDADGDGYGAGEGVSSCQDIVGFVTASGDCQDDDADINPGAEEVCDTGGSAPDTAVGLDNNCDGQIDEGLETTTYYADVDGDGFGDEASSRVDCALPDGYVAISGDCDDGEVKVNPDAEEVCNETDDNCDGQTDEGVTTTYYPDSDGDGYGAQDVSTEACSVPDGYLDQDGDCDDSAVDINPGATEVCNGLDDDCDGNLLEEEADQDGDGLNICADQDCDDLDADVGTDVDLDGDGWVNCYDDDDDGDGLTDLEEVNGTVTGFVTDPLAEDTDGDGSDDGEDAAPIHPACHTTLYMYDDFSANPSPFWQVVKGSWIWDAVEGTYENIDVQSGSMTWVGEEDWSDYIVEVRMRPDYGSGDPGIIFRVTAVSTSNNGGAHYYLGLYPSGNYLTLGSMDGSWHPWISANATLDPGVFYTVRLSVFGSSIQVELDDVLLIDTNDTTYDHGSVGFRTYNSPASYDYILVCD